MTGPPGRKTTVAAGTAWPRGVILRAAVIALAVGIAYWPVLDPRSPPGWLWDDDTLLTANLTVQHRVSADPAVPPDHLGTLSGIWTSANAADFMPLTATAFWLQWPLFGTWSPGYHLVNVLLHLTGSLLLWRLLVELRIPGAWLAAAVFAVHPVCVESVAWVSELKNTLSLPLFLLAAIAWVRFDARAGHGADDGAPRAAGGGGTAMPHALALACFTAAMLAKPSVVMLPPVLLLHAWWRRGAVAWRDLVRTAPFFLVSLVLGLVTLAFQHERAIGTEVIPVGGPASRTAVAGLSILWYVRLVLWPVGLLPIYPRWEVDPPQAWQFLAWVVIGGVLWWCWTHRGGRGRHALFGIGFFLLMVLPVLGFVTLAYMRITWAADHFIYLPMIGLVALAAAGVWSWQERRGLPAGLPARVATGLVLGTLTALSCRQASHWHDEDALWSYTLRHNETAWQAHSRLGLVKLARGHVADSPTVPGGAGHGALYHFTRATELRPDLAENHNNLGTALHAQGRLAEAVPEFVTAVRLWPQKPDYRVNLGIALVNAGRPAEAAEVFAGLVDMDPGNVQYRVSLGNALLAGGRGDEAVTQFAEAARLVPQAAAVRVSLANALLAAGRPAEAAARYAEMLRTEPDNAGLHLNLGAALFEQGRREDAVACWRRALEIDPGLEAARRGLAAAQDGEAEAEAEAEAAR